MTKEENTKWEEDFKAAIEAQDAGRVEQLVDLGFRHKTDKEPYDYLQHWLRVSRHFGYATHDGSWGEFEKEFAILVSRFVILQGKMKAVEFIVNTD